MFSNQRNFKGQNLTNQGQVPFQEIFPKKFEWFFDSHTQSFVSYRTNNGFIDKSGPKPIKTPMELRVPLNPVFQPNNFFQNQRNQIQEYNPLLQFPFKGKKMDNTNSSSERGLPSIQSVIQQPPTAFRFSQFNAIPNLQKIQLPLNSKQTCLYMLKRFYGRPQIIYLLDESLLNNVIDFVFEKIFNSVSYDPIKCSNQSFGLLKLFYAFMADAYAYLPPSERTSSLADEYKKRAINIRSNPKICYLENVYANLFIADCSYRRGSFGDSVIYSNIARKCSKTEIDKVASIHSTNSYYQFCIYLLIDEYYIASMNYPKNASWTNLDQKTAKLDHVVKSYKAKGIDYDKYFVYVNIRNQIINTKNFDCGIINNTILTAVFLRLRINQVRRISVTSNELYNDLNLLNSIQSKLIHNFKQENTKILFNYILDTIKMQWFDMLKFKKQCRFHAENCIQFLSHSPFLSNDYCDGLSMSVLIYYFFHDFKKLPNSDSWIEKCAKCIEVLKRQNIENARCFDLLKELKKKMGKNENFANLFIDVSEKRTGVDRYKKMVNYLTKRTNGGIKLKYLLLQSEQMA